MRTRLPKHSIVLSLLACLAVPAVPLAAEEPEDPVLLRVTPAEPSDQDRVTLHYQVFTSPCNIAEEIVSDGTHFDLVSGNCPILPPGPTWINLDVELDAPLAPGTYQMRYLFENTVIEAHTFTVREALGTCQPGAAVLCLGDRRFRVEADWQANGQQGVGQAAGITRDTGRFSFFDPGNVEVVVKVIEGCALNGRFWVFAAGLTDVATTLTVTDTTTGATRTYENPAGTPFAPVQDTAAFPCP